MARLKPYKEYLTVDLNQKGVLDVDTIKGCTMGIRNNPKGCWGLCYAKKIADFRAIDFSKSVVRRLKNVGQLRDIARLIAKSKVEFIRIGTMGDPCHAWDYTISIARHLARSGLPIIIITKHWIRMTDSQMEELGKWAILNSSLSALDTPEQIRYRLGEYERFKKYGKSILRIISCDFNEDNPIGKNLAEVQRDLFKNDKALDNPLRVNPSYYLVKEGVIKVKKIKDLNSEVYMSKFNPDTYIGICKECPDKCGIAL